MGKVQEMKSIIINSVPEWENHVFAVEACPQCGHAERERQKVSRATTIQAVCDFHWNAGQNINRRKIPE